MIAPRRLLVRLPFTLAILLLWLSPSEGRQPLAILDVPYLSQSEALCGGAAAAMVLRFWGAREVSAESFASLVDPAAAGIRTDVLTSDLRARGWNATGVAGDDPSLAHELALGRPVVTLIEDRPGVFHYVVVVARHDRAVVFHDPARVPFRVMARDEFTRRWRAAGWWMLVVVPAATSAAPSNARGTAPVTDSPTSTCDGLVTEGVRWAQAERFDEAERALIEALSCPGSDAARELAGVRLLQRRWPDVVELATQAVATSPTDSHAWKLLGTGHYLQDEADAALEAWNRAGEPRLDVVRVDSLVRTRHRVVEHALGLEVGRTLTTSTLARARRRLTEIPSIATAQLGYVPAPGGLAEVRGATTERPLLPSGAMTYAVLGLRAAATQEVRVSTGSLTGGGERITMGWRFRPHRPRFTAGVVAPAPWRGVWGVDSAFERQEFDRPDVGEAHRSTAALTVADWRTGAIRWEASAGLDRWRAEGSFAALAGALTLATKDDRARVVVRGNTWFGDRDFGGGEVYFDVRTSQSRRGAVLLGSVRLQGLSDGTPLDLWYAGDTGTARNALLRAHPVLDGGRLQVDRLGRLLTTGLIEAQRWWPSRTGLIQFGAAVFVDGGTTAYRLEGPRRHDVDVGAGMRIGIAGLPGTFRADLAKGLRDGATAVSFAYEP